MKASRNVAAGSRFSEVDARHQTTATSRQLADSQSKRSQKSDCIAMHSGIEFSGTPALVGWVEDIKGRSRKRRGLIRGVVFGVGLVALSSSRAFAADVSKVHAGIGAASSEYWAAFIAGTNAVAGSLGKSASVIVSNFNGQKLLERFRAIFSEGCENCVAHLDPASNAFTKAIIQQADCHPGDGARLRGRRPPAWIAKLK